MVEQDSKEDPVTDLLDLIESSRRHKDNDKRASSKEQTEVIGWYAIPASWKWVRLDKVGRIVGGGTPRSDNPSFFDDNGIPWLTPADLNGHKGKRISRGRRCITKLGLENSSAQLLPVGTVLFSSRAPIGYVAIAGTELATNQGFKSCAPYVLELSDYLYYFPLSAAARIDREASGTTFREVSGKIVSQIPFPLPPLAEQKRIVVKVDELMVLCDRLEAQRKDRDARAAALARASLERFSADPSPANQEFLFHRSYAISPADLRKAILSLAVRGKLVKQEEGDEGAKELIERIKRNADLRGRQSKNAQPLEISFESGEYYLPESWVWARFHDVAIIASNLVNPKDYQDFIHLAPDNIEKGTGVLLPCATVRQDKVISSNHHFFPGQIIYSKIRPNLAKVVIVDFEGLCSADMYPIDALIESKYLHLYMLSPLFLNQAVKSDTRVAMPKINQTELNEILVPVAPLAEQERIVAKVDELMVLVDRLESDIAASRDKAKALLAAAVAELVGKE